VENIMEMEYTYFEADDGFFVIFLA